MTFSTAFQRDAFQDTAFQIVDRNPTVITDPGSSIVAGTFSKGQWRDLKRDLEARRLKAKRKREAAEAALEAERQRQIAAIAAEIAARRAQEDASLAERLKSLWSQGFNPQGMSAIDLAAAQAAHGQKLAQLAKARREAEEEEEALALLMN